MSEWVLNTPLKKGYPIPMFGFLLAFSPCRPNPGRGEKINFFHTFLWCLKRFHEGLKDLHKTF